MRHDRRLKSKLALLPERFTGRRNAAATEKAQGKVDEASYPAEFARLKLSVIGPVYLRHGRSEHLLEPGVIGAESARCHIW